jgi:hypothetical protein
MMTPVANRFVALAVLQLYSGCNFFFSNSAATDAAIDSRRSDGNPDARPCGLFSILSSPFELEYQGGSKHTSDLDAVVKPVSLRLEITGTESRQIEGQAPRAFLKAATTDVSLKSSSASSSLTSLNTKLRKREAFWESPTTNYIIVANGNDAPQQSISRHSSLGDIDLYFRIACENAGNTPIVNGRSTIVSGAYDNCTMTLADPLNIGGTGFAQASAAITLTLMVDYCSQ